MDPQRSRYVCPACLRLDHEHCDGANGRPSLCQCDDPDPLIHTHAHPHNAADHWPYPGATKPIEGETTELAEAFALADRLIEEGWADNSLPVFTESGLFSSDGPE